MKKILEIKFGSHLYGTSTPESDLDLKSIYLPTADEIILHRYAKTKTTSRAKQEGERNKKDDIDIEVFSLDRFLELLLDGQTVALDMLFAPDWAYTFKGDGAWIMKYIYDNRTQFLNKNVNAFVGYARKQAAKYGVKGFRVAALQDTLRFLKLYQDLHGNFEKLGAIQDLDAFVKAFSNTADPLVKYTDCKGPNGEPARHLEVCGRKFAMHVTIAYAVESISKIYAGYGARALAAQANEGIDWKALSHAVRVNSEAIELLGTSRITFPCPNASLLLAIKTGQMKYEAVATIIEQGLADLEGASQASSLRAEPNRKFADDLILNVYGDIVRKG